MFFGIGGFELLLIAAIALFVLGPKRMLEGIREGRRIYSELKRQRDALQSLITEAIDLEELKRQVDTDGLVEGIKSDVKAVQDELRLDEVADGAKKVTEAGDGSVSRGKQLNRPQVTADSEMRAAIPDLNLSESADRKAEDSEKKERDTGAGGITDTSEAKS